ncbi:MAG: FecR domain-containing protein [Desulfobacterota bacterium]|nr:FecR domain-containing protein [Thermodesulfobacteriota bacterium]
MNRLKWMFPMILFATLPVFSYASSLGQMHISLLEGDVQIQTEETGDWVPASINMPLKEGDRIWVPTGGRLEARLRDGTAIRLDERTGLDILTLEKDDYQFNLIEGRAYINFRGGRGSFLQMETPLSSIRVFDRAIFRIDILDDRHADVSVYFGSIYAETREGRIRVDQDRTLTLREGAPAELGPIGPPDEWERWNRSRNRLYAERRGSSRYLPEELHPYSDDFDEHGRWVFVRGYGYVWTPTVVASAGWAPYRVGRWVWIRGDYVWISYEPWGWVPYHYGRWVFVPPFGWCWVPPVRGGVYWGPGFVAWVYTPAYICWVPLAPGEIYYGYGYFGPHSVNLLQVNIATLNLQKVVYKNVHVHNAVTIVHRDTFVHGRKVEVKVSENPFLKERIHIGRPDIRPERPTLMPVIREIHPERRPPKKIEEIRPTEIKMRRPLTRQPEASVIRPETPPREMEVKPKEIRPFEKFERKEDRIEDRPKERDLERRGRKPSPRELESPVERRPAEKPESPAEKRLRERGSERSTEHPLGKPPEKAFEKPVERPSPPKVERPTEDRKSIEPARERGKESTPVPEPRRGPIQEREVQKSFEERRQIREREIERRGRSGRDVERPQEVGADERRGGKTEKPILRGEGEGPGRSTGPGPTSERPSFERERDRRP